MRWKAELLELEEWPYLLYLQADDVEGYPIHLEPVGSEPHHPRYRLACDREEAVALAAALSQAVALLDEARLS
jgi:hypothetical protein